MILNDTEAQKRLNSPLNLINRLRKETNSKAKEAMALFIPPLGVEKKETTFNPFVNTPVVLKADHTKQREEEKKSTLDQILENNESQIKLGLAHDSALKLLGESINQLTNKLDDVKADKLPSAIIAASKVVESIRKERAAVNKNSKGDEVHYHFYTPEQKTIDEYEVIEVQ